MPINEECILKEIFLPPNDRKRFMDMGLRKNCKISVVAKNFDAIIAVGVMRFCTSLENLEKIEVEKICA